MHFKHIYFVILCLCAFTPCTLYAAFEAKVCSPRHAALGGVVSVVCGDADDLWYNPAGCVVSSGCAASFTHTRLFDMQELQLQGAQARYATRNYAFAAGYSSFGDAELYIERMAAMAYACALSTDVAIGCTIRNIDVEIPSSDNAFGSTSVWTMDNGLLVRLDKHNMMGAVIHAINRPRIGKDKLENVYHDYSIGYRYTHQWCNVYMESCKAMNYPAAFRWGVEMRAHRAALRCGMQTDPALYGIGFQVKAASWVDIEYAYQHHPNLGGQHLLGIQIKL